MNEYIKTIIYGITTSWQSKLNKLAKELKTYTDGLVSPLTKKIAKAQTAADKAQSTADKAQTAADNIFENETITLSFPKIGDGEGLPTFIFNGYNYYKVSDFVVPFSGCNWVSAQRDSVSGSWVGKYNGKNCYKVAQYCIVVTTPGKCELKPAEEVTSTLRFTATEAGIYTSPDYAEGQFDSMEINYKITPTILRLNSAGGKKWYITVDDSGTLSATEVT